MLTSVALLDQPSIVLGGGLKMGGGLRETAKDTWLPLLLLHVLPGFLLLMAEHPRDLALEVPWAKPPHEMRHPVVV